MITLGLSWPHVHKWEAPPSPDFGTIDNPLPPPTRLDWEWVICGQQCKCGARRIYEGPLYGWRDLPKHR